MKILTAITVAATLAAPLPALAEAFGPLLTPEELAEAQTNVEPLLIDIRGADAQGGSLFARGHIPGSVSAPYALFRGPASNPGQLVSEETLQETLRALGVTKDRPTVVIYQGKDITDFGAAARVYWTLKSSGVSQLAILNGGVDAWTGAGRPLSTDAIPPTPSTIEIEFSDQWLATTDDVLGVVQGASAAQLVDARPEQFWAGKKQHPAAAIAGTLPGSRFTPHSSWFEDGALVMSPAASVQATAASANLSTANTPLISFCNTGHWAATSWFAMSEVAGMEGVKLYPDSMVGYTADGHPVMNGPTLFE